MKKNKLRMLITILVGILLTSCSSVFDASINGNVVDDSGNGIKDMAVYAYENESARNAAYNRYNSQEDKSVFVDSSVPSARTDVNGNFSISTIRWKTNSPSYGKDGDKITIYLLFFNEEYGMNRSDEGYIVYSAESNSIGKPFKFKSIWETKTVNLRMLDRTSNKNSEINEPIEYTVKYNDGVEDIILHPNTSSFNVRYKKELGAANSGTDTPKLGIAISNIVVNPEKSKPQWKHTQSAEDGTISDSQIFSIPINDDMNTVYVDMYFKKMYLVFPGVSGYLYTESTTNPSSDIGKDEDDGLIVSVYNGSIDLGNSDMTEYRVVSTGDTFFINHGCFENVGLNAEIEIPYKTLSEATPASETHDKSVLYEFDPIELDIKYCIENATGEEEWKSVKKVLFDDTTSVSELNGLKIKR